MAIKCLFFNRKELCKFFYKISENLGRHKHKHKHKKSGQVRSSFTYAYAYVVALTSENGVDIGTSISTRPWTNHRSL